MRITPNTHGWQIARVTRGSRDSATSSWIHGRHTDLRWPIDGGDAPPTALSTNSTPTMRTNSRATHHPFTESCRNVYTVRFGLRLATGNYAVFGFWLRPGQEDAVTVLCNVCLCARTHSGYCFALKSVRFGCGLQARQTVVRPLNEIVW